MLRPPRTGFTLVELLVVIAIIGILTAVLVPSTMIVMERGRTVDCANNLHQIALGLKSLDNRPGLPRVIPRDPDVTFEDILLPKIDKSYKTLACPSNLDEGAAMTSYGFHVRLHRRSDQDNSTIMAMDFGNRVLNPYVSESDGGEQKRDDRFTDPVDTDSTDPESALLRPRHRGSSNVLFGDFHVDKLEAEFILFQDIDPSELTPNQQGIVREEFKDEETEVDFDELTSEQAAFIDGNDFRDQLFRKRWIFMRDEPSFNDSNQWTGEELSTFRPLEPQSEGDGEESTGTDG